MKAIVAVDRKWGIGKNNGLLFNIPLDMKFFKEKTLNSVVCMGHNTLLSFPNGKPLKNRVNIVLCPKDTKAEDCILVHSLEDLSKTLKEYKDKPIFVIGGAMFYKTMLYYCEEIYVTKVDADGEATVFYENLDKNSDFECVYESETFESNGYNIKFTTYKNNNIKEL